MNASTRSSLPLWPAIRPIAGPVRGGTTVVLRGGSVHGGLGVGGAHGAFCNMLDHASVEFHERYAPFHFTGHQMASSLATEAGALTTKTVLTSMVRDSGDGCRTRRIDERDDERYRADRSPEQLEHPSVVA